MQSVFTDDDKERVKYPMYTMMVEYFPDAFAALAKHCFESNEKHNPGEPMHWAREKSNDHKNKCMRHVMDNEWVNVMWRAAAQLQIDIENENEPSPLNADDYNQVTPMKQVFNIPDLVIFDEFKPMQDYAITNGKSPCDTCGDKHLCAVTIKGKLKECPHAEAKN